ncbi:MAG: FAD-binding oxidoreductase [Rhodobacteraceae bacterium]|jgi:D-amino-acid dehydrogenase|nr:FAD-binding oxidoreductase [Paracoccaceae bacterium]
MSGRNVLIVGGGIIGLAVAHHLLGRGHTVTILDRDPEGDRASYGNAGGIAVSEVIPASAPGVFLKVPGWLLDPLGPLAVRWRHLPSLIPWLLQFSHASSRTEMLRGAKALASLNNRTYDDLLPMLAANGLQNELHCKGALSVYETERAFQADAGTWDLRRLHGITCDELSGDQAREMEPALGPIVRRAVATPQWSHVSDPRTLHSALLTSLRQRGLKVIRGTAAGLTPTESAVTVDTSDAGPLAAEDVVIAAGAWSGFLAATIGDRVLLESERGYNTTIAAPGIQLGREIIFAERQFVATPLSCGLRIGGAAEFGGLDAKPNFKRSNALVSLAHRYFPDLVETHGTVWSGHRPATPDSLPVIGRSSRNRRVIHAFGHGHLGLTQAATTGRLVADLIDGATPVVDLLPFSVDRF